MKLNIYLQKKERRRIQCYLLIHGKFFVPKNVNWEIALYRVVLDKRQLKIIVSRF